MKKWEATIPTDKAEELAKIADAREESCGGHKTAMFDGQENQHRTGIYGEYGLSLMLGVPFDTRVRTFNEVVGDGHIGDVNGIEVKSTWWASGCLAVQRKKFVNYKPKTQVVLMTLTRTNLGVFCKARGWAYIEEITSQPDNPKFAYAAPSLEQRELRSMDTLVPDA